MLAYQYGDAFFAAKRGVKVVPGLGRSLRGWALCKTPIRKRTWHQV